MPSWIHTPQAPQRKLNPTHIIYSNEELRIKKPESSPLDSGNIKFHDYSAFAVGPYETGPFGGPFNKRDEGDPNVEIGLNFFQNLKIFLER